MTTLARKILDEADIRGIHPIADLFPLMSDEELGELADDIRENGLKMPIITSPDGLLLDGRNRLVACHLAGVTPSYQVYDDDPVLLITSLNLYRRHLTHIQRSLLLLRTSDRKNPESRSGKEIARSIGVDASRFGEARVIYAYADELVDELIAGRPGSIPASEAYELARARRDEQRSEAERQKADERQRLADAKARETRLAVVRVNNPELADQVEKGTLALEAAEAAMREQQKMRNEDREAITRNLARALDVLLYGRGGTVEEAAAYTCEHWNWKSPVGRGLVTSANLRRSAAYLNLLADWLAQEGA